MCIFIVCVLKCTYIQQSSCKLSQLQPNQTKLLQHQLNDPDRCKASWKYKSMWTMFSDSFIGMCWKGCWASRRRWLETWTMTRTRSCWSRRGAGEVQCNWVWREGVGGGGQCDIRGIHEGRGDFKQVGNVTHALLCNVMLEGKKSMWCGDGEAGEKCDACGLGGILNAVGRDKNVLEEVGEKM